MKRHMVDVFHGSAVAWVILCISLVITLIAWFVSNEYANDKAVESFKFEVHEAQGAIEKRFSLYEQVLRSGLGLFTAGDEVDRDSWRRFIDTLEIDKYYPGTQGIGYSVWLAPEQVQDHVSSIRNEGFPDFSLRPDGIRDAYTSIIYLEPFDLRNRQAFGFDMFSEPTRRKAMSRARDTGETALSGKVTLVQEITTDVQAGFLLYLPHYIGETKTLDDRRKNLVGFVYSALRIGDLMNGILSSDASKIDFEIYDGEALSKESLLYDSNNELLLGKTGAQHKYGITQTLDIGGHTWSIFYNSNQNFDLAVKSYQPAMVAISGIVIDVFLFYVIYSLSSLRKRAIALADERMSALKKRDLQFKSISDTAYDGITFIDNEGIISYANRSAGKIFDLPDSELNGKNFLELFPEEDRESVEALLHDQKSLRENTALHTRPHEVHARRANGDIFPLELVFGLWTQGDTTGLTAVFRDITERHRMDILKKEFISTVSHELRTPLTSIMGSFGLLQSGKLGVLNDKAKGLVEIGYHNSERLTRIVNDILDIEKMAHGKMQFHPQQFNVMPLVESCVSSIEFLAQKKNVSLRITGRSNENILVDKDRFIQIMTNLIGNAIKFSPQDSPVDIQVSANDVQVSISITDHGPGIPKDFQDKLYNRFTQADSSDTRKFGGSGLGLNIAKTMVEHMNGSIVFNSIPDQTTTFTVTFPIVNDNELTDDKVRLTVAASN